MVAGFDSTKLGDLIMLQKKHQAESAEDGQENKCFEVLQQEKRPINPGNHIEIKSKKAPNYNHHQ